MELDSKFINSQCTSPVTIKWRNPLTNVIEDREVPCGKCYHCKLTKVCEWYTRMYLNSCYRNYTYFITTTYDVSKMTTQQLDETHACVHSSNTKGVAQLAPLTLCKRHIQLFFKRLRKQLPNANIQYYVVGEYGKKYGRPHYHMNIWSDVPLTEELIADIWKMGRVDVQDVTKEAKSDKTKTFGYVCKYLFKDFDYRELPTLKYHKNNYEKLEVSHTYEVWQIKGRTILYPALAPVFDCDCYFKTYGNFMLCSKGRPIGIDYLQEHLQEFRKGNLRLFGIHDADHIFPNFFKRKAQQSCCPYSPLSPQTKGLCSNSHIQDIPTYVGDNVANMQYHSNLFQFLEMDNEKTRQPVTKEMLHRLLSSCSDFYESTTSTYYLLSYWKITLGETDPLTDEPIYVPVRCYDKFKYSRKTRMYEYIGSDSIIDVLRKIDRTYQDLKKYFLEPFYKLYLNRMQDRRNYIEIYHHSDVTSYKQALAKLCEIKQKQVQDRQRKYYLTKNQF